jgi:hypothetical protein
MGSVTIHIDTVNIDTVSMTGAAQPSLAWHVGPVIKKGMRSMPLDLSMSSEEQCRLSITPLTPGGDPASIDGEAVWSVEGTCTLGPIDATSTWVIAGDVGDSTITVMCDADMGDGVVHIADTCVVHVATPMAANLGLTADAPVLKT